MYPYNWSYFAPQPQLSFQGQFPFHPQIPPQVTQSQVPQPPSLPLVTNAAQASVEPPKRTPSSAFPRKSNQKPSRSKRVKNDKLEMVRLRNRLKKLENKAENREAANLLPHQSNKRKVPHRNDSLVTDRKDHHDEPQPQLMNERNLNSGKNCRCKEARPNPLEVVSIVQSFPNDLSSEAFQTQSESLPSSSILVTQMHASPTTVPPVPVQCQVLAPSTQLSSAPKLPQQRWWWPFKSFK